MSRPAFDPWLAHLRRDRRGLPVPYINLWGEQTVDNTYIAHDPLVGMTAEFVREDPAAAPNFFKQHRARQRECMVKGLCQVCGRFIPWSRRNLVVAPNSVDTIVVAGRARAAVFEPWLDDRCADLALNWCPALIRRRREEQLVLVPVRSQHEVQMTVSRGWLEGPLEAVTKASNVAMVVRVILSRWNIHIADGEDQAGTVIVS